MKKNILWVLAAIMSMGILASCSDDDDDYYVYTLNLQKDTQIKYTDKGVWDKAYTTDDLTLTPSASTTRATTATEAISRVMWPPRPPIQDISTICWLISLTS